MAGKRDRVHVDGVREVQAAMKQLEASSKDLSAVHRAVAGGLLPGIVSRTPRRSGTLAGSWAAGATKTRARLISKTAYGGVIEYGWAAHGIEPARMVRDTIEGEQAAILEGYERGIAELGARVGFKVKT